MNQTSGSHRLLLVHHAAYPGISSLGVGLGFRRDRRGSPQLLQVYFAEVRDSLDVAAAGDCSSAIKPKVEHRPIFLPAIPFLVEPIGCWAATVARFQEARRHSQGVAELGYVSFQYVRLTGAGFTRLSIRSHMGIRSIAVKMFIIHIFNSVQPFSRRGHGVDGDSRNLGIGVVRWFVSSRRESHGSGCRSDHWCRVWDPGQVVAGCSFWKDCATGLSQKV